MQKWLFPALPGISYLGRFYDAKAENIALSRKLSSALRIQFNHDSSGEVQAARLLNEYLSKTEEQGTCLLSAEGLLAQCIAPPDRRFRGKGVSTPSVSDALLRIRNVCDLVGDIDCKILVSIRPQHELISSFYAEGYKDRFSRWRGMSNFEEFVCQMFERRSMIRLESFDYCHLADHAHRIFGPKNVFFLHMKWIEKNQELMARSLGEALSIPPESVLGKIRGLPVENRRRTRSSSALELNRKSLVYYLDQTKAALIPSTNLGLGKRIRPLLQKAQYGSKTFSPSEESLARISNFYTESNREFGERFFFVDAA